MSPFLSFFVFFKEKIFFKSFETAFLKIFWLIVLFFTFSFSLNFTYSVGHFSKKPEYQGFFRHIYVSITTVIRCFAFTLDLTWLYHLEIKTDSFELQQLNFFKLETRITGAVVPFSPHLFFYL